MRAKRGVVYLLTCCISFWLLLGITACTKKNIASLSGQKEGLVAEKAKARLVESYGKLPLSFIQNEGQVDGKVKFYEKGRGHATFFTEDGIYISLLTSKEDAAKKADNKSVAPSSEKGEGLPKPEDLTAASVRLTFLGANKAPEILGENLQKGKVNYLIGNDSQKWRTDIPTYGAVVYREVYKGVDIRFQDNNRHLQHDIIVKPGADPSVVRFSYEGIEGLKVTKEGDLEIALKEGKIGQKSPIIYQEINGSRIEVAGGFKVLASNSYGFDVALYDRTKPLIIDPTLVYSTYGGGSSGEFGLSVTVDDSGNAYGTGYTGSTDFPIYPFNPFPPFLQGEYDIFVSKLDPSGAPVYSTFLGGSGRDKGFDIAVDNSGAAYVVGITDSYDFPTANPIQGGNAGYRDAFVTKLDPSGSNLIYSTYLGGSGDEFSFSAGIAVDLSGNAYITGATRSYDFPTANPIQATNAGVTDVFVTKINPLGTALVYSTYLGGSIADAGYRIAVDSPGNAYITGTTHSPDFPTANPYQGDAGGADVFVAKLNPSGTALAYSTYLGGNTSDWGYGIAVNGSGNAYIAGYTRSTDFPTANPYQVGHGGGVYDTFVTQLDSAGNALVYSTYLGGSSDDYGRDIALSLNGSAYITGFTISPDFPTVDPIQGSKAGDGDAFVTQLAPTGSALVYSTYLGGSSGDFGIGIAVDGSGSAYIIGHTYSTDFPTVNAVQGFIAGTFDVFGAKLALNQAPVADAGPDQSLVCTSLSETGTPNSFATLDGSSSDDPDGDPLAYAWTGPFPEGGGSVTGVNPTVTLNLGTSIISLVVYDGLENSDPDTVEITTTCTPQEHIGLIIDEVEDLLAAGVMTQGQCNALIVKLEDAIQHLNRGNKKPAIKKLEDFIHQVNNRMQEGTLSLEQGQLLINATSEVITAL